MVRRAPFFASVGSWIGLSIAYVVGCDSQEIAVVRDQSDAASRVDGAATEPADADSSASTNDDDFNATCSTGPARAPSVPLPGAPNAEFDGTCLLRCGTSYGIDDIAPFSALPNGPCAGTGACSVLAIPYCDGKPTTLAFDDLFVCSCSAGEWSCAVDGAPWTGFTCPDAGESDDAGASDASRTD